VSVDVQKQGTDSEGKSSTRRKGQATRGEGEQEVEAAHCTAAAGEKNCGDGRIRAGEQEGSEEGDERGKRSRTHMQN
jgi:hypothetical protein